MKLYKLIVGLALMTVSTLGYGYQTLTVDGNGVKCDYKGGSEYICEANLVITEMTGDRPGYSLPGGYNAWYLGMFVFDQHGHMMLDENLWTKDCTSKWVHDPNEAQWKKLSPSFISKCQGRVSVRVNTADLSSGGGNRDEHIPEKLCVTRWDDANMGTGFYSGACGYPSPPGANTCDVLTSPLEIDHGLYEITDATEKYVKTEYLTIKCDGKTKVRLTIDEPSLKLGNGVNAKLKLENETFTLPKGKTEVPIESTLTVNGEKAQGGEYSASTVARLTYE